MFRFEFLIPIEQRFAVPNSAQHLPEMAACHSKQLCRPVVAQPFRLLFVIVSRYHVVKV